MIVRRGFWKAQKGNRPRVVAKGILWRRAILSGFLSYNGLTGSWAARGQPDAKKPYRYLGSPVLGVAALPPLLNGVNITSDLIKVRKIVTGEQSQHHAQGFQAALIVLAGALQILR